MGSLYANGKIERNKVSPKSAQNDKLKMFKLGLIDLVNERQRNVQVIVHASLAPASTE
jgi:hypothetical protein